MVLKQLVLLKQGIKAKMSMPLLTISMDSKILADVNL